MAFEWFKALFGRGEEGDHFGPNAMEMLSLARTEAERLHHHYVGTEHLFLGMLRHGKGTAIDVLRGLGLDFAAVTSEVEKRAAFSVDPKPAFTPYTQRAQRVLALAARYARVFRRPLETDHILLGILEDGEGVPARVLKEMGVTFEKVQLGVMQEYRTNPQLQTTLDPRVLAGPSPGQAGSHDNNFTPRSQQALALARKEADRFNHNFVGTEHVLLGILKLGQGVAVNVLQRMGLDLDTVRLEVEKHVGSGPDQKIIGPIPYTPRTKKVLSLAGKQARALRHTYVGTEHILLGLLEEGDGVAARVLRGLGVDPDRTRLEILKELDPNFVPPEPMRKRESSPQSPDLAGLPGKLPPTRLPFTLKLQKALVGAGAICREHHHEMLGPEHLLMAILIQEENAAVAAVEQAGYSITTARWSLARKLTNGDDPAHALDFSEALLKTCHEAHGEALRRNQSVIGTDSFLLATLSLKEGPVAGMFDELPLDRDKLRAVILSLPAEE